MPKIVALVADDQRTKAWLQSIRSSRNLLDCELRGDELWCRTSRGFTMNRCPNDAARVAVKEALADARAGVASRPD